jgi:hypothetical protein
VPSSYYAGDAPGVDIAVVYDDDVFDAPLSLRAESFRGPEAA